MKPFFKTIFTKFKRKFILLCDLRCVRPKTSFGHLFQTIWKMKAFQVKRGIFFSLFCTRTKIVGGSYKDSYRTVYDTFSPDAFVFSLIQLHWIFCHHFSFHFPICILRDFLPDIIDGGKMRVENKFGFVKLCWEETYIDVYVRIQICIRKILRYHTQRVL